MPNVQKQVAVLVVSCDRYSDLWKPFFQMFRRFWPECQFPVYLLSNQRAMDFPGVTSLVIGSDPSWSDSLKMGLECIPEKYVLLFIDDLFLVKPVDNQRVLRIFEWMVSAGANHVRMNAGPLPDKPFNDLVGVASPGTIYRTSTVMSVWKKSLLMELLKAGESAWDFEIFGTERSDAHSGFYASWKKCFPVVNGVIKGKWQRCAVKLLQSLGADLDLGQRGVVSRREMIKLQILQWRSNLLTWLVPAAYRRRFKHWLLRGRYNYRLVAKKN